MKIQGFAIAALACATFYTHAALQIDWNTGYYDDVMIIDGVASTAATFNSRYDCRLVYIGNNTGYTSERGFPVFIYVHSGVNIFNEPGRLANAPYTEAIPDQYAVIGDYFLLTIYEKSSGKYFLLSDTPGGTTQYAYPLPFGNYEPDMPPDPNYPKYYPNSPTGYFYIGAPVPAFCTWLSSHGITESDISDISPELVNAAFAVKANPTNFTGIALSTTSLNLDSTGNATGSFSLTALDAAHSPSTVTALGNGSSLTLLSSATPNAITNKVAAAAVNIPDGSFTVTNSAPDTRFFRLRLSVPQLWP